MPLFRVLNTILLFLLFEYVLTVRYDLFSTKNTFENAVRSLAPRISSANSILKRELESDNCIPLHVSALIRHGIRNPGFKDLMKLDDFLSRVEEYANDYGLSSSKIAEHLISYAKRWRLEDIFARAKVEDKELSGSGFSEMQRIGGRYLKAYRSVLIDKSGKTRRLRFTTSNKQRTEQSCEGFKSGLGVKNLQFPCKYDDYLLRFFDRCDLYAETMNKNDSLLEAELFKMGPEIDAILKKFQNYFQVSQMPRIPKLEIEYR